MILIISWRFVIIFLIWCFDAFQNDIHMRFLWLWCFLRYFSCVLMFLMISIWLSKYFFILIISRDFHYISKVWCSHRAADEILSQNNMPGHNSHDLSKWQTDQQCCKFKEEWFTTHDETRIKDIVSCGHVGFRSVVAMLASGLPNHQPQPATSQNQPTLADLLVDWTATDEKAKPPKP